MATNLTLTFHGETELLILARCCYLIRLLKHQYHGSRKKILFANSFTIKETPSRKTLSEISKNNRIEKIFYNF